MYNVFPRDGYNFKQVTQEQSLRTLEQFEQHRENIATLFAYSDWIRKVIYTINAIESLNSDICQTTKRHKLFPSDEAATKVVYLAITQTSKKWTTSILDWRSTLNQFSIMFKSWMTDSI